MAAETEPDTEQTRAELSAWVSNLDRAIDDLRSAIEREEREQHR